MNLGKIFVIIFLLSFNASIFAEEKPDSKTVTATGVASIINDKLEARNLALNDALRKAVEQAVGIIVSSNTIVENFQLLNDNVYTHTEGYIKSYKVVDEKSDYNTYQLTIEAEVGLGKLENDLATIGLISQKKNKPRILFMISEENTGGKITENKLKGIFHQKGFNVVEGGDAQSIGEESQAEVVIRGKAIVTEAGVKRGNVGSYSANITATAFRMDNEEILASAKTNAVSRHIDAVTGGSEALERAASELAEELINQVIQKWNSEVSGTISVKTNIDGVTDYANLTEIIAYLQKDIPGVAKVIQRNFDNGKAVLDLELRAINTEILAKKITEKKFKNFKLNVISVSANAIALVLETKME